MVSSTISSRAPVEPAFPTILAMFGSDQRDDNDVGVTKMKAVLMN